MQPNSFDNYDSTKSNRVKLPKNITLWMYLELKNNLENQIRYLKDENAKKDELISKMSNPVQETPPTIQFKEYKPVGNRKSSARALSEMEDFERRKYWESEIQRREALINKEGNNYEESKSKGSSIPS